MKLISLNRLLLVRVICISTVSIINAIFDSTKKQNIPGAHKTAPTIFLPLMGIDNLLLSPELLSMLYPEGLVIPTGTSDDLKKPLPVPRKKELVAVYPFLGGNGKNICFLVNDPDHEFISEQQLVFMNRILSACKLTMDDISVINLAGIRLTLEGLKINPGVHILFLWGITPDAVGIFTTLPPYEGIVTQETTVIYIPSPDTMNGNTPDALDLKRKLWSCLQKIFTR